jgi:hypothetical protein
MKVYVSDDGSASARGYEFEQFVLAILEHLPEVEIHESSHRDGQDQGVDFAGVRKGRPFLMEVKATTPQTSYRLEQLAAQLKAAAERYRRSQPATDGPDQIAAFPGVLAPSKRAKALQARLEVWDGPWLHDAARELDIPVPPYVTDSSLDEESVDWLDDQSRYGQQLLRQLHDIQPGQRDWLVYEKFCEELLNFLFVPPLNRVLVQNSDEHANRRDFILPNYAVDGSWWQFMRSHYEAHYVVAEAKNLSAGPGKREVLQVAHYLNPHGTGLFAMVFARSELNDTAKWLRREQWVQHNKLIIGLDDTDVAQMVATKLAADDPAELVRQKIEDFRLGI